jgi:hypothetical protein
MSYSGIIFYSVTNFVEQVGRRVTSKYGDLDRLTCTYTGPASTALQFKPAVNSAHPNYPLMFVTDTGIRFIEALVAEVEVTYVGMMQTNGGRIQVTPPVSSQTRVKGSRDYTRSANVMTQVPHYVVGSTGAAGQVTSGGYVGALYNLGTQQVTVYYIGTESSIRYHVYPQPSPFSLNYYNLGMSLANVKQVAQIYGPISISASGLDSNALSQASSQQGTFYTPTLAVINLGIEIQQEGKWYTCTETYGPAFLVQGIQA